MSICHTEPPACQQLMALVCCDAYAEYKELTHDVRRGVPSRLLDVRTPSAVVAIPICNERAHIENCLNALAAQSGLSGGSLGALLFLNNCTDDTREVIEGMTKLNFAIRIIERDDPSASAGWARSTAMNAAAAWLEEAGPMVDGVLLTTDADSRVRSDWVFRNLLAIDQGADLVAGCLTLDKRDAAQLPPELHARGRLEAEYTSLLTEIEACLDPAAGNPWPNHWCASGATLATRLSTYRRLGGMPSIPVGEDRAFVEAARANDLVVRHAPDIEVVTSGRLFGRAHGGVADTIRYRCAFPDSPCDDRLEKMRHLILRVVWRKRLRELHAKQHLQSDISWRRQLRVPLEEAVDIARLKQFGQVFAAIVARSPRLAYRPLRPSQLPDQISLAKRYLLKIDALKANTQCHLSGLDG